MIAYKVFKHSEPFTLENGQHLPEFKLRYATYGMLNERKDNVVWVCHAFTGSADFLDWWSGMFGEGKLFDPKKYFIVCANILGSCYGSTGPLSVNPETGDSYYHSFPVLSTRDLVGSFELLRKHIGISQIHTLIGCSMGGQLALEWAIESREVHKRMIVIGTNAKHSPWGIAFNESQRMAIAQDPTWQLNAPQAGVDGMKTARSIALISYRNYSSYAISQEEGTDSKTDDFKASSYQRYQGEKLARRFNAFSYWTLSKIMDSHNVGRSRESTEKALGSIRAKTLVVGVSSDQLFPIKEQRFLASH
ncbi:MAG: homoserine O-acetyltransferase, partial [Cytophagales bacterium]|nr:homoserine O-acetyltransferase [Cytophagales bacterium]